MIVAPEWVAPSKHVRCRLRVEDEKPRRLDHRVMVTSLAKLEEEIESGDINLQYGRA